MAVIECLHMGVHAILSHELAPMVPIVSPFVLSRIHNAIGNGIVYSSERTNESSLLDGRNKSQDAPCVRGKSELNLCKNCKSESSYVSFPAFLKDRLERSAILLWLPAMVSGASGEDWLTHCHRQRAQIRH